MTDPTLVAVIAWGAAWAPLYVLMRVAGYRRRPAVTLAAAWPALALPALALVVACNIAAPR